jgi:hypothetical protein
MCSCSRPRLRGTRRLCSGSTPITPRGRATGSSWPGSCWQRWTMHAHNHLRVCNTYNTCLYKYQ